MIRIKPFTNDEHLVAPYIEQEVQERDGIIRAWMELTGQERNTEDDEAGCQLSGVRDSIDHLCRIMQTMREQQEKTHELLVRVIDIIGS
jgi:hypothetical protein